jgi:hypothetical protein
MIAFLAAIAPSPEDPLAGLAENKPPVNVPWPPWVWWAIGAGAVIVLGLLIWLIVYLARQKKTTPPLSPRALALLKLKALRDTASGMDAYAFAVAVSDVLRGYISQHYSIQATQQTSPEFLASIATSSRFSDEDRRLLAAFLEQCDLRKFARVDTAEDEALLTAATNFVQGPGT